MELTKVPALESAMEVLDEALDMGLDFGVAAAAAAAASCSIFFLWAMVLLAPIPAILPSALKRIEPRLPFWLSSSKKKYSRYYLRSGFAQVFLTQAKPADFSNYEIIIFYPLSAK